jgi:hypothetical protein
VAGIARIARVPFNPPAPYVRRGKAGMTVIAWLAEVLNQLGGPGGALVAIGHPVVGSAIDWIEATLDIGEAIATTARSASAFGPASRSRSPARCAPWRPQPALDAAGICGAGRRHETRAGRGAGADRIGGARQC